MVINESCIRNCSETTILPMPKLPLLSYLQKLSQMFSSGVFKAKRF